MVTNVIGGVVLKVNVRDYEISVHYATTKTFVADSNLAFDGDVRIFHENGTDVTKEVLDTDIFFLEDLGELTDVVKMVKEKYYG